MGDWGYFVVLIVTVGVAILGTYGATKDYYCRKREQIEAELRQKYEAELNKHKPTLSYLEQKAQRLGLTVEQLIENDRKWEEQQKLNKLIQKNIPPERAD